MFLCGYPRTSYGKGFSFHAIRIVIGGHEPRHLRQQVRFWVRRPDMNSSRAAGAKCLNGDRADARVRRLNCPGCHNGKREHSSASSPAIATSSSAAGHGDCVKATFSPSPARRPRRVRSDLANRSERALLKASDGERRALLPGKNRRREAKPGVERGLECISSSTKISQRFSGYPCRAAFLGRIPRSKGLWLVRACHASRRRSNFTFLPRNGNSSTARSCFNSHLSNPCPRNFLLGNRLCGGEGCRTAKKCLSDGLNRPYMFAGDAANANEKLT